MSAPNQALSFTAVLLAGGQSRRMGCDKATLCPTGEPLWSRQLNLLRQLPARNIWISARVVPAWCPPETQVVLDATPSRGPLSGISTCLLRLETTHLIVLAVDMPRMTADHLRRFTAMAQPGRSVIPRNGDLFEPLCAIYANSAADHAARALARDDTSLQRLCASLLDADLAVTYPIPPEETFLYLNLNRPEDVSAI